MATAGHFVTMLGVLAFYFMILDSKAEKKFVTYLHTLVARFNKRATYYLGKLIFFKTTESEFAVVPVSNAQKLAYNLNGMS